jgi:hypothetical protein
MWPTGAITSSKIELTVTLVNHLYGDAAICQNASCCPLRSHAMVRLEVFAPPPPNPLKPSRCIIRGINVLSSQLPAYHVTKENKINAAMLTDNG